MKQICVWLVCLLLLPALLAGCADRPTGGQIAMAAGEGALAMDFPALVLDFDATGKPMPTGPLDLELLDIKGISISPDLVQQMTDGNVQHLQLDSHPHGLAILVNGQPLFGSLRYDSERLASTMAALDVLAGDDAQSSLAMVGTLLPLLDNLGIGVIARFPLQEGVEAIPYADMSAVMVLSDEDLMASEAAAREAGLVDLPLAVAEDGSLTSDNFMFTVILSLIPPDVDVKLPEDTVQQVREAGITEISLKTRSVGLSFGINGHEFPMLTWNNGELDNFITFAYDASLWREIAPDLEEDTLGIILETVVPLLQATNFDIVMKFPDASAS